MLHANLTQIHFSMNLNSLIIHKNMSNTTSDPMQSTRSNNKSENNDCGYETVTTKKRLLCSLHTSPKVYIYLCCYTMTRVCCGLVEAFWGYIQVCVARLLFFRFSLTFHHHVTSINWSVSPHTTQVFLTIDEQSEWCGGCGLR